MLYAAAAVERAMKIQQVIMRALSGAITWLQAADILGLDPRSVRRWRARFDAGGRVALYDRRCLRPSRRKAPALEVQRILRLYRERFAGWNVRHFYRFARRDHRVTLSYSFVKLALQEAGLVRQGRARGPHRRRREPRACPGTLRPWAGRPLDRLAIAHTAAYPPQAGARSDPPTPPARGPLVNEPPLAGTPPRAAANASPPARFTAD